MKMYLNIEKFNKLQSKLELTETDMAKQINVSRTQLWRAKAGEPIGEKFIGGLKVAFPKLTIDDFFLPKALQDSDTTNKNHTA